MKKSLFFVLFCALTSVSFVQAAERAFVHIYDASVSPILPTDQFRGMRVLVNGEPTNEVKIASKIMGRNLLSREALQLNDSIEKTQQFYSETFGRVSYDGAGTPIYASVNVNRYLFIDPLGLNGNAAWMDQFKLFVFGHGDGWMENFTGAIDVVAHEFTHAVISSTSNLAYQKQSGALNEHLADLFGVMVRQYHDPAYPSPFLLGDRVLTSEAKKYAAALRDMLEPNKGFVWQPAHVSEIPETFGADCVPSGDNDQCGVHYLSGIPNRASALIIQSIGWENARKLFYPVMTRRLNMFADFKDYRREVLAECLETLPIANCDAVSSAFDAVGVTQ